MTLDVSPLSCGSVLNFGQQILMNPHPEATVRQPSVVPTTGPHGHAIDPMPATVIHIEGPPLDYLISHW